MEEDTTVSVGICAHEEEETIGKLLDQVREEEVPLDEIVVVVAGEDRTAEIVKKEAEKDDRIEFVEEEERRGQVRAQNEIFERVEGGLLFLVDGDGTMKEGSTEVLYRKYAGESILCCRETPVTGDGVLGWLISLLWDLHHGLCLLEPKFSTQLVLIPGDLIERFPEELVLDDEYIAARAQEEGMEIEYVPEAVKYHNTPENFRFYINQRRKNWAGRFQIEDMGYDSTQSNSLRLKFFFQQFLQRPWREKIGMMILAGFEILGISLAVWDRFRGGWPNVWYR